MGGLVSKGPSPGTVKTLRRFMDISTTLVMLRASCALAGMMSHIGDSGHHYKCCGRGPVATDKRVNKIIYSGSLSITSIIILKLPFY